MIGLCALATAGVMAVGAGWSMGDPAPVVGPTATPAASILDRNAGYWLAPKAFRAAADRVLPSMVTIETFGGLGVATTNGPRGGPKRGQIGGISRPGEGPTTGLIVSPDGYIITSSFNFIARPNVITVILPDGTQHVARMLGKDETRKLTLIKIDGVKDLPVPTFADPAGLKVGQWAVSVGVGYGDDNPAISQGIISGKNRVFGKAVQTDANISPANYGGPLVDDAGRVIGICVPLSPMSGELGAGVEWYDSGIGFAVPLYGAEKLIEQLKDPKTEIKPGKLGVQVDQDPNAPAEAVVIKAVMDNSAAKAAGLVAGDIIVSVNGKVVNDFMDLRTVMGRFVAGEDVTLHVKRGAREMDVKLTLTAGVDDAPRPQGIGLRPGDDGKGPRMPDTQPASTTRPTPDAETEPADH